jgi:hypothetical protein
MEERDKLKDDAMAQLSDQLMALTAGMQRSLKERNDHISKRVTNICSLYKQGRRFLITPLRSLKI